MKHPNYKRNILSVRPILVPGIVVARVLIRHVSATASDAEPKFAVRCHFHRVHGFYVNVKRLTGDKKLD